MTIHDISDIEENEFKFTIENSFEYERRVLYLVLNYF